MTVTVAGSDDELVDPEADPPELDPPELDPLDVERRVGVVREGVLYVALPGATTVGVAVAAAARSAAEIESSVA